MGYEPITAWEEHQFWLAILKDHAYFIRDYLSEGETKWVQQAKYFIQWFDHVEKELSKIPKETPLESPVMVQLSQKAYEVSYQYYLFEGNLLKLRLYNEVHLNLTPSYLSGTLAENREYLRILTSYVKGKPFPPLSLVDLLSLWLDDQVGHASLLIRMLDGVELTLIERATALRGKFSQFIVKNDMMKGFLYFVQQGFPVQIHFAHEVSAVVVAFNQLVEEVLRLYLNDEVLNQASLRFLEHHFPEACYFMKKLSFYAPTIQYPPCKLTKPSLRSS